MNYISHIKWNTKHVYLWKGGGYMQDNKGTVQGVLTLNYNSHEDKNIIEASAAQLSAGESNSVVLLEYSQEKEMKSEDYIRKESTKYSIDADKLIDLIKQNGSRI